MKKLALAGILLVGVASLAWAATLTWPPPAGFIAIYPPVGAVVTNCGGSITAGGTAQPLFTAAQFTQGFILEVGANDSPDAIYFSATTTTPGAGVAGSFSLNPSSTTSAGGSFVTPLNFPVNVIWYVNGATTGDKYKCNVW